MTRREMLAGTGSALAWMSVGGVQAQAPMLKNMGGEPLASGIDPGPASSTSSSTAGASGWAPSA